MDIKPAWFDIKQSNTNSSSAHKNLKLYAVYGKTNNPNIHNILFSFWNHILFADSLTERKSLNSIIKECSFNQNWMPPNKLLLFLYEYAVGFCSVNWVWQSNYTVSLKHYLHGCIKISLCKLLNIVIKVKNNGHWRLIIFLACQY